MRGEINGEHAVLEVREFYAHFNALGVYFWYAQSKRLVVSSCTG